MYSQSDVGRTYYRSEGRSSTGNTYDLCERLFEVLLSDAGGKCRIEVNDLFPAQV